MAATKSSKLARLFINMTNAHLFWAAIDTREVVERYSEDIWQREMDTDSWSLRWLPGNLALDSWKSLPHGPRNCPSHECP